jgi:hypothetical protein
MRVWAKALAVLAVVGAGACGKHGASDDRQRPPPVTVAGCDHPRQGEHYGMCARLSTVSAQMAGGGMVLRATADAGASAAGAHYAVQGGTFHAVH